jgi:DNA ligase-1
MNSNLIKIFKSLKDTNSILEKKEILKTNSSNQKFKDLLKANLDPYRLFQFNKMPSEFIKQQVDGVDNYEFFMALLKDLETRAVTGNKAKELVISVFKLFNKEEFELYSKILLKEPIGIGSKIVNSIYGNNFIKIFSLMLAPSELPNLTTLQYPLYVQPKYDGFRCVYYKGNLWTRSGLIMPNKNLAKHFNIIVDIDSYIFDGELYTHGSSFQDLTKILASEDKPIPKGLKYFIYDCMPVKDWEAQKTKLGYSDRLKLIRELVNGVLADYSKYVDAPTDLAQNPAEVIDLYKKYLKDGYEGCMLKAQDGKYRWKRVSLKSGEMIKLKPFKSEDLEIIDVVEGEGKFQGTLGSIIVSGGPILPTSVGSGFSDDLRKEIWTNKNKYVGKTAEIKYFEVTEDNSLRFPIFERIREDK